MEKKGNGQDAYADLLHLPHHVSPRHPRLSMEQRAAQFAPFAALSGFGEAIDETARMTADRAELTEEEKSRLDERLRLLEAQMDQRPQIQITYFQPDQVKCGGEYVTVRTAVKRIDRLHRKLILQDDREILVDDIYSLDEVPLSGSEVYISYT